MFKPAETPSRPLWRHCNDCCGLGDCLAKRVGVVTGSHWMIVLLPCIDMVIGVGCLVLAHPPGQNGRHFADDIFWCILVNEKFCMLNKISLKFVRKGPIDNNPALV